MLFFTAEQRQQLLTNGQINIERREAGLPGEDFRPVVKLFTPDAGCTWLLTEINPRDQDIAFGLCDLGQGDPELGTVSLAELAEVRGWTKLPVERDLTFVADRTLSAYAADARLLGRIAA